ncbi:MAG: glycosyltransferase family 4 protein [Thermoplasmata archaeon]
MRILLASHRYFPVPGGTEKVVQTLAEGLVRKGHPVSVVTREEPGSPAREELQGVEVRRLPTRSVGSVRVPVGYVRALRRSDAELFHLWGNRIWCADFYFPWARWFRWPQVLTGLGFYQWEVHPRWIDRVYFRRYFPRAVRRFDAYTTSSERERGQLLEWGVPAERLRPVPLGVPLEEFVRPPDGVSETRAGWGLTRPLAAVYAGGFFENKRVDRLLDGLEPVRKQWALIAIGGDAPGSPYGLEHCRRQAERQGIELRTPGRLPRPELIRSIFASDAIVLGSEYEGFGLLPIEANAAGRPFVAFESGALGDIARRGGGVLVRSPEEMASALERLSDPAERSALGRRGRDASGHYSGEAMVERFLEVYRAVIARRNALGPASA